MSVIEIVVAVVFIGGIIYATVRAKKKPRVPMNDAAREREQRRNGIEPKEQNDI